MSVRGRFAPSPTGALHLGNARTALLAWLEARAAGGRFVMRVEDLDPGRVRPGLMEAQLADLRWLGLDWDEGPDVGGPHAPYLQTERTARYDEALGRLAAAGLLFACTCSRKDIAAAASAPHAGDEGPRYPGTCRERIVARWPDPALAPTQFALRLRTETGDVCFDDAVHGRCCIDPAADGGDFVVRRRDGVAAYQLAVVVDDAAMEITDVVRGADLLSSTPRQILLYDALGWAPPAWTHVPLLLGEDGERLAKRHGAVSLADARAAGVAPEAVAGWLAATCGLAGEGERVAPSELVARFRTEALPRAPTRVTAASLASLLGR